MALSRALKKTLRDTKKLLDEFPDSYDATMDQLSDRREHAETVNRLLGSLRAFVELVEKQK